VAFLANSRFESGVSGVPGSAMVSCEKREVMCAH
jgi:hypothetical protein